jgi:uncharacterized protein YqeY
VKSIGYKARATGELKETMSENLLREELAAALKVAIDQDEQRTIAVIRLVQVALKERDEQAREDSSRHRITDDELVSMLAAMVEQRQDSMRRYEETGQLELAEREADEIEILRRFLPPQLDEETRELAIEQVIAELGASKLKDIGKVMTELKSRYPGQMNFAAVRRQLCDQLG